MPESSSANPVFKVGFLVNPDLIEQYHLDLMDSVAAKDIFDAPHIIEHQEHPYSKKFRLSITYLIKSFVLFFIKMLEISNVRKNSAYKKYHTKYSLDRILSIRRSFIKCDEESLGKDQFDILINFSYGKISNSIFQYTKFGVIKPFRNILSLNQNLYLGFSEVLKRSPQTSINILYSKNQDENFLIFNGKIMTRSLWHKNRAMLLNKSNALILTFLNDLAAKENFHNYFNSGMQNLLEHKEVTISESLKYFFLVLLKLLFSSLLNKFNISKKQNRWSVAYFKGNDFNKDLGTAHEIKNLPGRFFADPFVINYEDRTICFVEDFFFSESRGKISAIEIFETGYKYLDIVLDEDFHLSYPYIFIENENLYMIPETSEINEIRLYQSTNFPIGWELKEVLMKEVSAVDTVVFKNNNLWFMLTNICSSAGDDHSSELHVFYSDKLDSQDWKPIKQSNPVIFDSLKARNGGFFQLNNKQYRVNQVQDFSHYGKCFEVNLITEISTENYKEEKILEMHPNFLNDIISTHHYNSNGDYTVFDYCKNENVI